MAWAWAIPASQLGFPGRAITLSSGQASLVTAIIQCYRSSYPAFMPFSLCRKLWNRKSEKLQHQEEHATAADLELHSRLLVNFAQKSVQIISAQFRDRPEGSSSHYLGRKEKVLLLLRVNGFFFLKGHQMAVLQLKMPVWIIRYVLCCCQESSKYYICQIHPWFLRVVSILSHEYSTIYLFLPAYKPTSFQLVALMGVFMWALLLGFADQLTVDNGDMAEFTDSAHGIPQ